NFASAPPSRRAEEGSTAALRFCYVRPCAASSPPSSCSPLRPRVPTTRWDASCAPGRPASTASPPTRAPSSVAGARRTSRARPRSARRAVRSTASSPRPTRRAGRPARRPTPTPWATSAASPMSGCARARRAATSPRTCSRSATPPAPAPRRARCSAARGRRDHRVALVRADARRGILYDCGPRFAALGLAPEPGVAAQLDDVLDRVVDRARHFAESVYPPHTLGPTAERGPFPVGVQTLALVDPSRTDVTGSGPRPVTIEVYYPSTPAAVAGV